MSYQLIGNLQTDTNSIITPAELAANNENSPTSSLNSVREIFDANSENIPTQQPWDMRLYHLSRDSQNHNVALWQYVQQGWLQCVTWLEQIHGLQVDSSTTVIDLMVQNDTFRGIVSVQLEEHVLYELILLPIRMKLF